MQKLIYSILILVIALTGCSQSNTSDEHQGQVGQDNQESVPVLAYNIGSNDWSAITNYTDSKEILEAYQYAVEHPEVLDHMPCYCGCYETDGHMSNTHCFVDRVEGDVVYLDTMGFS